MGTHCVRGVLGYFCTLCGDRLLLVGRETLFLTADSRSAPAPLRGVADPDFTSCEIWATTALRNNVSLPWLTLREFMLSTPQTLIQKVTGI